MSEQPTMRTTSLRPKDWDAQPSAAELNRPTCVWETCGAVAVDVHMVLRPETALCVPLELCMEHLDVAQQPSTILLITMTTGQDARIVAGRWED